MFSRREREYLRALAAPSGAEATVELYFPNPVYRRKLGWSIRRKVEDSIDDWELYASAAERDMRVRLRGADPTDGEIPLYTEPFASAVRTIGSLVRKMRSGTTLRERPGEGGR